MYILYILLLYHIERYAMDVKPTTILSDTLYNRVINKPGSWGFIKFYNFKNFHFIFSEYIFLIATCENKLLLSNDLYTDINMVLILSDIAAIRVFFEKEKKFIAQKCLHVCCLPTSLSHGLENLYL